MQTVELNTIEVTRVCLAVQNELEIKTPASEKQPLANKFAQQAINQVAKTKDADSVLFTTNTIKSCGLNESEALVVHLAVTDLLWVYRSRELRAAGCTKELFAKTMSTFDIDTESLSTTIQYIDNFIGATSEAVTDESIDESLSPFIIHFSQKLTNTKALGGVFVPVTRKSKLPYLSSGSIQETLKRNLLADISIKNNASTRISIINSGDKKSSSLYEKLSEWYENKSKNEVNCDYVNPRLTQLLLPKEDGSYVSITPLSSGGMLSMLKDASFSTSENKDESGKPMFAGKSLLMPIGGANPVNTSLHNSNIQVAWLHKTPEQNFQIRRAFSVFYRGFRVEFDRNVLKSYAGWLNDPKEFFNDRDTVNARSLEIKTSPLYKLISKVSDDVNAAMDDFNGARENIAEKIESGEPNKMESIEMSLYNGTFDIQSLTNLVNIIITRLVMNIDDVPISYTEQTKSRHKALIFQILKDNINYTVGV